MDRFQLVLNKWGREFLETRSSQYAEDHEGHKVSTEHDLKLGGDQGWGGTDVTPGDPASFWLEARCECGKKATHWFNNDSRMYAELDQIWVVKELVNTDIWGVDDAQAAVHHSSEMTE